MAWTTPSVRSTGDLITASIWNTDLKDNLRYLKGMDGQVTIEDDVIPNTSALTLGESSNPWGEGDFYALYASPRYAVHRYIREVTFEWADDTMGDYQIDIDTPGAGQVENGGTGQIVFIVNDNGADGARVKMMDEQDNALANAFNASRSPYYRQELAINHNVSNTTIFLGLRQTPGAALPLGSAENYAGFVWNGTIWAFQSADGTAAESGGTETINADTRYVFEILIIAGTGVECWLNGTLMETLTTRIPTGDLKWQMMLVSDGGGGGTDTIMTIGKSQLQEDLS